MHLATVVGTGLCRPTTLRTMIDNCAVHCVAASRRPSQSKAAVSWPWRLIAGGACSEPAASRSRPSSSERGSPPASANRGASNRRSRYEQTRMSPPAAKAVVILIVVGRTRSPFLDLEMKTWFSGFANQQDEFRVFSTVEVPLIAEPGGFCRQLEIFCLI